MKNQSKKALIAFGTLGVIASATIGGVVAYGKYSESAKGFKLETSNFSNFNFSNNFQMDFVDDSGESPEIIGEYKTKGIGVVDGLVNGKTPEEFLKDYRNDHPNATPYFRIKSGLFNFENRYIAAVPVSDWLKFVFWYIGDGTPNNPGHLSYGPEAGELKTFQIVSGIEQVSKTSIMLGGMATKNHETKTITFYPDAFFGTFQMFSDDNADKADRLMDYFYNSDGTRLFTMEQAKEALDLISKVNEQNKANDPNFKFENTPIPYQLEPAGVNSSGEPVYKISIQFLTAGMINSKTIIENLEEKYPELLSKQNGPHIVRTGESYEIKDGAYKTILPSKNIGLAQILKISNPNFKGFGIDFLKYVGIHEYGHHETLSRTTDISDGGVQIGFSNSTTPMTSTASFQNLEDVNNYLDVRSDGLKMVKVDAYGNEITDKDNLANAVYGAFKINNNLETDEEKFGKITVNGGLATTDLSGRAMHETLASLRAHYLDVSKGHTLANAYLMNAFDTISGTANPTQFIPANVASVQYKMNGKQWVDLLRILGSNNSEITAIMTEQAKIQGLNSTADLLLKNGLIGGESKLLANISSYETAIYGQKESVVRNINDMLIIIFDELSKRLPPSYVEDIKVLQNMSIMYKEAIKTHHDPFWPITGFDFNSNPEHNKISYLTTPVNNDSNIDKSFFDSVNHKWVGLATLFASWKDGQGNLLFKPSTSATPDIDLSSSLSGTKENTKFDLISIKNIYGVDGKNFYNEIRARVPNTITDEEIKTAFLQNTVIPTFNHIYDTTNTWSSPGAENNVIDNAISQLGANKRPAFNDKVTADYHFQFPEVMTRDFVQMTFARDAQKDILSNTNNFLPIRGSNTSLEYYISKTTTANLVYSNDNDFTKDDMVKWVIQLINAGSNSVANNLSNYQQSLILWWSSQNGNKNAKAYDWDNLADNKYFGITRSMSNGFEVDHKYREALNWTLYNDNDGSGKAYNGPMSFGGKQATTIPEAYWYFMLKNEGIYGDAHKDRSITGIYRNPADDRVYTYGYLRNEFKSRVKYIAFKNKETGSIKYMQIHTEGVANKFYLTRQGDVSSKRTLNDEGYFAWTTEKFTAGGYANAQIGTGEYETFFVDENKQEVTGAMSLGERNTVAENGKLHSVAPSFFEKDSTGRVSFVLKGHK